MVIVTAGGACPNTGELYVNGVSSLKLEAALRSPPHRSTHSLRTKKARGRQPVGSLGFRGHARSQTRCDCRPNAYLHQTISANDRWQGRSLVVLPGPARSRDVAGFAGAGDALAVAFTGRSSSSGNSRPRRTCSTAPCRRLLSSPASSSCALCRISAGLGTCSFRRRRGRTSCRIPRSSRFGAAGFARCSSQPSQPLQQPWPQFGSGAQKSSHFTTQTVFFTSFISHTTWQCFSHAAGAAATAAVVGAAARLHFGAGRGRLAGLGRNGRVGDKPADGQGQR